MSINGYFTNLQLNCIDRELVNEDAKEKSFSKFKYKNDN